MTTMRTAFGKTGSFVPPEPSSGPPAYDERYIPRWAKVAVVLAAIAIAVIAITMMAR
jgi:hypothetical protein